MLCNDLAGSSAANSGYTPRVADMRAVPQWLKNLREMVGTKRGDASQVARDAQMKLQQLQRILSGDNLKPQVNTLAKIALACGRELEDIFTRPESAGHETQARVERDSLLDVALARLDAETPAEDSWRGDILKAVAALNRALRRPDENTRRDESDRAAPSTRR